MSGHAIHITINGRKYTGIFNVDRKFLTVSTTYGKKTAEVGVEGTASGARAPSPAGVGRRGESA